MSSRKDVVVKKVPALSARLASAILCVSVVAALLTQSGHGALAQDRPASRPAATRANPYDAEVRRLQQEVTREGRAPRGILPLLELYRTTDRATPGVVRTAVEALSRSTSLRAPLRVYAQLLASRLRLSAGDVDGAAELVNEVGLVRSWRVIGSFDNEGKNGFNRAMPPEEPRTGAVDMDARYPGRERSVSWRMYPDVSRDGYINFDALFRPYNNVCGYAETLVRAERPRPVTIWVGAGGAVKVFVNGAETLRDDSYRRADPDRSVATVSLHAGWNRILVKDCITDGSWGFYFRIGELDGSPARGLTFDPMAVEDAVTPTTTPARATVPAPPQTPLVALEAGAAGETPRANALADLAEFLAYTSADDPAERRAKQLAARAADIEPTVGHLQLAATLADERAEVMRFASRALEVAPTDPGTILMNAVVASRGPEPTDALPILDRIPEGSRAALDGVLLRAAILSSLDLDEAARALIDRAAEQTNGAPAFVAARAGAAAATSRRDLALELRRQVVALRYDDISSRQVIIDDALRRGDTETVITNLEVLHTLYPGNSRVLADIAGMYDALGRDNDVIATYREALALAPEDAGMLVALGRANLRMDQRDAATEVFRRALALRPQDADTRELLEQIHPEVRQDEAFAATREQILARRTETTAYPITVLQHLVVNTVFDNGLGSSFHQIAVQVNDSEGTRRFRTYSMQFDPESQRIDVRLARVIRQSGQVLQSNQEFDQPLGEPWYRIYYNTLARVVVFPDLEPGDVVELRYRIDDVSHRNAFADYYGDLQFLQTGDPQMHMEYVLLTPASREFYFNEPHLAGLEHTRRVENGRRMDRFVANDIPAIRGEDGMPGMTEIAPYLHVSTYRTWQDVGRWWWGLVQDQLYADESLKRTVAELMRGASDTREKTQRIYDWVVSHTRYVGLEFGIHGYLPYRVPQIIQRGFGDCKDKASVLYTMLREAGIDARIVLVRTRRNGNILDLPASLAVFDHAIAYVPELDLYLDGTAENSGTTELPTQDQGVTVLVVGPNGAELRRTPVLDAALSHRERQLTMRVAADGSAEIDGEEEVRGAEAQGYRATYEAEGTRRDRFERALAGLFPGADLIEQRFQNLDRREQPVRYTYRVRVPQLASRDNGTLRLAPTVLNDLVRVLARTQARHYPLDIGSKSSYTETRTIRPAQGLQIGALPTGGEAASDFGRLHIAVERTGRDVVVRTEFSILRDRVSPEEYPAFRQWVERADALLRERLTLTGGAQ